MWLDWIDWELAYGWFIVLVIGSWAFLAVIALLQFIGRLFGIGGADSAPALDPPELVSTTLSTEQLYVWAKARFDCEKAGIPDTGAGRQGPAQS